MKKGIMFILVLMILLSLVFSGCGKQPADTDTKADPTATPASTPADNGNGDNGGDEGTLPVSKITDEKITLKFARLGFTDVRPPAGELWMWKRYEEMTNIHIEWEEIPPAGFAERKNIMMAASDLPDAFYQAIFSNEEIGKYGSQGTFIKLNDLIAQYGPNINKLMQKDETVRKAMTMPDGNIYSLPYTQQDYDAANLRYYINQEWLANLGLNMPTSIEELSNILRAFKEQDANGNGDPNDEYPIYFIAPTMIEQQLLGSFGLGNRGLQGMNALIDMGPDGKVRFFPTDPKYKEVWQLMNDWWEAGYWHPETWSGIDYARWVADGSENKVGLFSWVTPKYIGADTAEKYWGINALKGPDGDAIQTWQDPLVRGIWSFMITNKNQYPVTI
jgi:putative aldouronate transport system substrate-binding protein